MRLVSDSSEINLGGFISLCTVVMMMGMFAVGIPWLGVLFLGINTFLTWAWTEITEDGVETERAFRLRGGT